MKIINTQNLDEWLFDYFEGNLNIEEKERLTEFLHKNPAFKADYDAWKTSYINEPEVVYPAMDRLLKPKVLPKKWIKWSLGGAILISLFLVYLFYPNKTTSVKPKTKAVEKTIKEPIKQNKQIENPVTENKTIEVSDKIYQGGENKRTQKIVSGLKNELTNENQIINNPEKSAIVEVEKNDSTNVNLNNTAVDKDVLKMDSLEKEKITAPITDEQQKEKPLDKPKKPAKAEKERKQMKIIKLKNTGF